ncbi:MAG: helix-turn-helix domain-containing protein [Gemmatimonadetes bacterium]|nr:helix-turn-helix domain-containing protein [Gemmatimonadota bacterium]
MTPLSLRLREAREDAGLTQVELAEAAGVSQRAISELESGKTRRVDLDVLELLARAVRVAPGDLLVVSRRR